MSTIAIITARGGSKRIPRKNIKDFCGKPIIAYSIEAALNSGVFDEVMVSTDDEEIARIAESYDAKIPFLRSAANSDDFSTTSDVLLEVVKGYERDRKTFDTLCCIYPTAPFVSSTMLQEAFKEYQESDALGLMSVARYDCPPQRALLIKNGGLTYAFPQHANARSQDLEPVYHDCGMFYFRDVKDFMISGNVVIDGMAPYILKQSMVQDIDTMEDWIMAEFKFRMLVEKELDNG